MAQPLTDKFPIVDPQGKPTPYFIRLLQERGFTVDDKITAEQALELINDVLSDHSVNAGTGLSGGGPLLTDPTLTLNASLGQLNDVDLSTPPTNGQVIAYDAGSSLWLPVNQSGGGGGGSFTYWGWGAQGASDPVSLVGSTTASLGNGSITNALVSPNIGNHYWFNSGGTTVSVTYDFVTPVVISGMLGYQDNSTSQGSWQPQYSDDGSTYTNIGTAATWGGATRFSWVFSNIAAHRYWRLAQVSGTTSNSPWQRGVMFRWGPA